MARFELVTELTPQGDQPQAIESLVRGVREGAAHQTLLGVTGSGKTFTMAHVIAQIHRPTLVISHNKTLAAQLYSELKSFFPHNAVEYFVSYYDYYQPEAYIPQTDTYIEKDSSINEDLDRLRLSATSSLAERRDVIIVASVSCIYNLGDPEEYRELLIFVEKGKPLRREELISWLVGVQYARNDIDFKRGTFRVRGDVVDIYPAYRQTAYRIELEEGRVARVREIHPLTADTIAELEQAAIYPAKHFVSTKERVERALILIEQDLQARLQELREQNTLLEAQRLMTRTRYDMDMLKELGFCHGVENYSRFLDGRAPGSRPSCLVDHFPKDLLVFLDESHVTIPQVGGMYEGDRARKTTLIDYGFRLPSALDNRPLRADEFWSLVPQVVFVSATPGPYELRQSGKRVVEQVIRPTGLLDPAVIIKPTAHQIEDLAAEVKQRAARKERVLVTTLTKRLSEDLTAYLSDLHLRVKYLHSEIDAIERVQILRDLRLGEFDALIGVNLLREGLDLPEVSLVAVLDADKEGFLRSETSLIQVAGRAARHERGEVIFYADRITGAMRAAMREMDRRRVRQAAYNKKFGITPTTIQKAVRDGIEGIRQAERLVVEQTGQTVEQHERQLVITELEEEMELAARHLQFERAAYLRDELKKLHGIAAEEPLPGRRQLDAKRKAKG